MSAAQEIATLKRHIQRNPLDPKPLEILFDYVLAESDVAVARELNRDVRKMATVAVKAGGELSVDAGDRFRQIHKKSLLIDARECHFDSYLQYVEYDRPYEKKFYLPRRHYLLPVVRAYQEVADGQLDLLIVQLIKRAGKSQISINFVDMLSGANPGKSTLMEGSGDALVQSFYSGCLEYLHSPSEYLFYDIFPAAKLVQTNADTKVINLEKRSRFPTIMCRSIDARQIGLSEATNLLALDDCVDGREEAKDRNRLDKKWEIISGDVLGRRLEGTPIVASGTRYSIYDPLARLEDKAKELGWRYKVVSIPALDPITDESNYEYIKEGKKQFSTAYLQNERLLLSEEQWESEFQLDPFEAKGVMFPESQLKRFFFTYRCQHCKTKLKKSDTECPDCKHPTKDRRIEIVPDKDPDAIISVCDSAEKGADSVMLPIAYVFGEDVYIADCVFDNSPPTVTKPLCARKLIEHKVSICTVESNAAGEYYGRDIQELVTKYGGRTNIRTKRTISNKHTRIEMASDGILKHFFFLDKSLIERGSQYWNMLRELTSYTRTGKSPHDDAPDGLSLLENELRNLQGNKVTVMSRSALGF